MDVRKIVVGFSVVAASVFGTGCATPSGSSYRMTSPEDSTMTTVVPVASEKNGVLPFLGNRALNWASAITGGERVVRTNEGAYLYMGKTYKDEEALKKALAANARAATQSSEPVVTLQKNSGAAPAPSAPASVGAGVKGASPFTPKP